jgi:RNA polymerase sigma factor (sigma-70 family)
MRRASDEHDHSQPAVSWDLARIATLARAASRAAAGAAKLTPAEVCHSVAVDLAGRTTGAQPRATLAQAVVASVCAVVEEHAARASRQRRDADAKAAGRELLALVHSGTLASRLAQRWEKTEDPGPLEEHVTRLARTGVDAEALLAAVIGYEAQYHTRLVWHEAHKLAKRVPDTTPEDLFGWGWIGLRVAMRNFDPQLGYRFATYACQRISGAMRDGVRSEHPLPKRLTTFQRKISRAEEELNSALGRQPTLAEIAEHLGETLEALEIVPRLAPAASLEELAAAGERTGDGAWLAADTDPAADAVAAACREAVERAIDELPPEEAEAARLLYWSGMSVPEAREVTGATARQLRARASRAREQLAESLAEWR